MKKNKILSVGDVIKLYVYPEIHCEDCCEIIHNHIDCPICGKDYSPTDQYYDLSDENETMINCQNCKTVFQKKIGDHWYLSCTVRIFSIDEKFVEKLLNDKL
jgi:DNA-directed RNA polymerase subunit RPC12/RpoP